MVPPILREVGWMLAQRFRMHLDLLPGQMLDPSGVRPRNPSLLAGRRTASCPGGARATPDAAGGRRASTRRRSPRRRASGSPTGRRGRRRAARRRVAVLRSRALSRSVRSSTTLSLKPVPTRPMYRQPSPSGMASSREPIATGAVALARTPADDHGLLHPLVLDLDPRRRPGAAAVAAVAALGDDALELRGPGWPRPRPRASRRRPAAPGAARRRRGRDPRAARVARGRSRSSAPSPSWLSTSKTR